eukprot:Hpha_TRINITY_DN14608_c0_g1::TRINITY_DN14608_c0_g1_i1::g.48652::m.48652
MPLRHCTDAPADGAPKPPPARVSYARRVPPQLRLSRSPSPEAGLYTPKAVTPEWVTSASRTSTGADLCTAAIDFVEFVLYSPRPPPRTDCLASTDVIKIETSKEPRPEVPLRRLRQRSGVPPPPFRLPPGPVCRGRHNAPANPDSPLHTPLAPMEDVAWSPSCGHGPLARCAQRDCYTPDLPFNLV